MNKLTKRAVAALLSGLLVLGQAGPALAAQDDSNYGPAFSTKVEQTSPGSSDGQSGEDRAPARRQWLRPTQPRQNRPMGAAQQPAVLRRPPIQPAQTAYLPLPRTKTRRRQQTTRRRPMRRQPRPPSSRQRKLPDRHQPIRLLSRFRCFVRTPHGRIL